MHHHPSSAPNAFLMALEHLPLRRLLEDAGYRVVIRAATWTEALVIRDQERWLGRGISPEEALADVLGMMLPSALGRSLFLAQTQAKERPPKPHHHGPPRPPISEKALPPQVAAEKAPIEAQAPEVEPTAIPVEIAPPAAAALKPSDTPAEAHALQPLSVTEETASSASATLTETASPEAAVQQASEGAASPDTTLTTNEATAAPPESSPVQPPAPKLSPRQVQRRNEEDLAALEELTLRFDEFIQDIAWLNRGLQRLILTSFSARVRHINTGSTDDAVQRKAHQLIKRISSLTGQLWPGSVPSLNQSVKPNRAFSTQDQVSPDLPIDTWAEVAMVAETLFERRRSEHVQTYKGSWGWADTRYCQPAPIDPDSRLEQVRHSMSLFFGDLEKPSVPAVDTFLLRADNDLIQQLLTWAKNLRWLRPHVEDRLRWGQAMGRLRWACSRVPRDLRTELDQHLNEFFIPPHAWASLLGEKPQQKQRQKLRKDILQKMPQPSGTQAKLITWLTQAFDAIEALPINDLAERVTSLSACIRELQTSDAIPNERRFRRNLSALVRYLDFIEHGTPLKAEDPIESSYSIPDNEDDIDEGARHFQALLHQVRERTKGKRTLFISNRKDQELKDRLESELGLAIEWTEIDPRRIDARVDSVRSGNYDLILSATGFQGHDVDVRLSPAARNTNTPYIRVDRGRLNACVRAIARHYGLVQLDA